MATNDFWTVPSEEDARQIYEAGLGTVIQNSGEPIMSDVKITDGPRLAWVFKVKTLPAMDLSDGDIEAELDEYTSQGWELVSVVPVTGTRLCMFFFKGLKYQ